MEDFRSSTARGEGSLLQLAFGATQTKQSEILWRRIASIPDRSALRTQSKIDS